MRPYKASSVPPAFVLWHGLYYREGHWHEIRNAGGELVTFETAKAAIEAAKGELQRGAQEDKPDPSS